MKLKHIEIVIATLILLFCIYTPISFASHYYSDNEFSARFRSEFKFNGYYFSFIAHYFLPKMIGYLSIYLPFLWVATSIPNSLIEEKKYDKALLYILPAFVATWFMLVVMRWIPDAYYPNIIIKALFEEFRYATNIFGLLLIYQLLKQLIIRYVLGRTWNLTSGRKRMIREILWFLLLWGITFTIVVTMPFGEHIIFFVILIVPSPFIIYLLNVNWLLKTNKGHTSTVGFWLKEIFISLCVSLPLIGSFCVRGTSDPGALIISFVLIWLIQMVIIVPLSYWIYLAREKSDAEISGLRNDLGNSAANLQFLRSQINPHFLFNALNTLYGTALTENAEKTAEGIQKLGDMMRFMLHENTQDKIILVRELAYLENYISLQNLRMEASEHIKIEVQIEPIVGYYEIAPMLLIPFIENAYKHGISFREQSWITVNLYLENNNLHFDVHNSIHAHKDTDPEKDHSGIGLENVKQRLQLLYTGKHELVVRQNTKEFFIHLTLQLK